MNRVQVILSGFSVRLFCFVKTILLLHVWLYGFLGCTHACVCRCNSRFLGLVSVWAARSFDQTALRPSVIKRIRQIDVKYITHITSFGVTA